jgi:hypothetical protein
MQPLATAKQIQRVINANNNDGHDTDLATIAIIIGERADCNLGIISSFDLCDDKSYNIITHHSADGGGDFAGKAVHWSLYLDDNYIADCIEDWTVAG